MSKAPEDRRSQEDGVACTKSGSNVQVTHVLVEVPPPKVKQINIEAIPKAPALHQNPFFCVQTSLHISSIPMGASGQNSSAGGCGAVGRRKWRRGGGIPI